MNEHTNAPVGENNDNVAITDIKHFYIDAEGNRVEYTPEAGDGEAAREEITFIAERHADHAVDPANTVH